MRSTDYVTPFIDCLNNENVSEKAYDLALNGLNHVLSYNLASDATASTIVDILNDRVIISSILSVISGFKYYAMARPYIEAK